MSKPRANALGREGVRRHPRTASMDQNVQSVRSHRSNRRWRMNRGLEAIKASAICWSEKWLFRIARFSLSK
jgi:hypothetical protein